MRALALVFLLILAAGGAGAVEPDEILADASLERRARALSLQLRCLVCQNQSIDDSDAPLARDLRLLVRARLTAGDSDEAVLAFVAQRYGDFVLLRPPFKARTLMLWLTPLLALGGGLAAIIYGRRAARAIPSADLSMKEKETIARLLDGQDRQS